MPSIDAYDDNSFKIINRPHKDLKFQDIMTSLIKFSHEFKGKLWLETMILKGINDSEKAKNEFKKILQLIKYDKYYLNSPVRPPAVSTCEVTSHERLEELAKELGGINIDALANPDFFSNITDDYEAILSIIRRHPMDQYELKAFLDTRNVSNINQLIDSLKNDKRIEFINYKGYDTFRFKVGE